MFRPVARSSATVTRPEWELLVCCARTSMDADISGRILGLVREAIDWNHLADLATTHHVTPLLYRSLSTVCPDAVPAATMAVLKTAFSANFARNLALGSELIKLLKSLAAHQIPAIPFKGPTLASLAYGSLALRQAGDLDVLVRQADAITAKQLLVGRGFRPCLGLTDEEESERSHHFILVRDVRPVCIEIHWRLINDPFCFNMGEEILWRDKSSTKLAGVPVPCFPTHELLIYLCAHGTKHCWQRLSWICDIAQLLKLDPGIDLELVMRKARAIGSERMLSLGLLLAAEILGAPLTEPIRRKIERDATTLGLAREVIERYLPNAEIPPEFAAAWSFNVRARERRRDRNRCRVKLTVPAFRPNERDFAFLRLPPRLSFLYGGVKSIRLASAYGLNPSRFLRMIGNLLGIPTGRRQIRNGARLDLAECSSERLHQ